MAIHHNDCDKAAKKILAQIGNHIVLGVPLGIGKPIGLLNAFYRLAIENKSIHLTIITGLTLSRPTLHHELEKRLAEPILERILSDFEDPLYEDARKKQLLPDNIKIIEFYLMPGKYLKNNTAQQDYISSNYTTAARDALNQSINVVAQLVTRSNNQYSLSSNTDLFHDTLNELANQKKKIPVIAEVNLNLPIMLGDAIVEEDVFTDIIDTKKYRTIFSVPKAKISAQDYLIGLYSSTLIKDGGCLQIGIGKLGDAIAYSLILRHKENALYQEMLKRLKIDEKFNDIISQDGSLSPFNQGLYTVTEMLTDSYMHLYDEKILKKKIYNHAGLQRLLNEKKISENITPELLTTLVENKIINSNLTDEDFRFLQQFGIFKSDISFQNGNIFLASGDNIPANLKSDTSMELIIKHCLGTQLTSGKIIFAGFFLGSNDFYQQLKNFSHEELQQIAMTSISKTNSLLWSHELSAAQHQQARFINTAMMVTAEGSIISDGLKNWIEVSGVGGQFDFAVMAQNLQQARFIINCHSTRNHNQKIQSNILWEHPNTTIPRHLRDIVITEYGIADCRSKTDAEVIKAILNITDSRFQNKLLSTAKKWGKIESNYTIPDIFQNNYPETINSFVKEFRTHGYFPSYPFGSELTQDEQVIEQALLFLKNYSKIKLFFMSLIFFQSDSRYEKYLQRMKLNHAKTFKNFIYKKLLKFSLSKILEKSQC